ncbi:MAG TPA: IclR family transcriptional regulator [Stellaceae bacterium]|nr:IclR family transcriptional regulator [Stellaceae bacterium]
MSAGFAEGAPVDGLKTGADKKSSVQSLAKAFRLLEAIAASEADLTLSELASAAHLDPGTTHRMLKTLIELGYVERVDGRRFTLTLKVLDLGFRAIGRRDIRALARPLLRTLVGEVSEAASLGVLAGSDVLYVERMRAGLTRLGVDIRVGTLIPAAATMMGWAILAFLPAAELDRQLRYPSQQHEFTELVPQEDLGGHLAAVRAQGYALSPSRISTGLTVLAVPVCDQDGYPIAGLSVAAPSIRMTPEELRQRALRPLLDAADIMSRGLAASGGTVTS